MSDHAVRHDGRDRRTASRAACAPRGSMKASECGARVVVARPRACDPAPMTKRAAALAFLAALAVSPAMAQERRCGWIHNPSPSNWWLVDRDGQWDIMAQGGPRPSGVTIPDLTARHWVRENGYYGYGCACMSVVTDARTRSVRRIVSVEQLPLERCRADRALPRP